MANKSLFDTLTMWAQNDNPNFRLIAGDKRCGNVWAIGEQKGTIVSVYTPYLPLKELEQYLQGVYHAKEYLSHSSQSL